MKKKEKKTKEIRKPTKLEAFSTLVVLLALVLWGSLSGINVVPMLILGTVWACFIGLRCGHSWKDLEKAMATRIGSMVSIFLILMCIGIMMSTFMYSGTIPVLIYYLIDWVSPGALCVIAFILCAIVALVIGTSWGTAGTIGIVMISLGSVMGAPMPILAGAVVSGAHVGQLLSPMADMTNLGAGLGETQTMPFIKRSAMIAVPSVVLCVVFYLVVGLINGGAGADVGTVAELKAATEQFFSTNVIVLLPLVVLLVLCLMQKPIVPCLLVSSALAIIIGMVFNGFSLSSGLTAAWSGFKLAAVSGADTAEVNATLVSLVNRGGITSWANTILTLFCAMAYAGVMVEIGAIHIIAETTVGNVKSRAGLAASTVFLSIITDAATSSSYMGLIIPADLMKEKYIENDLHPADMAAIAQTVAAIFMPIIPWNATTIYMEGITGVSVYQYMPYAIFCWGTCLLAILFSFFGFGYMKEKYIPAEKTDIA